MIDFDGHDDHIDANESRLRSSESWVFQMAPIVNFGLVKALHH